MARVKAVLRRIRPMFVDEVLTYKGIVIDLVSHSASRDGETLHLGPTEFNLLAFFTVSYTHLTLPTIFGG